MSPPQDGPEFAIVVDLDRTLSRINTFRRWTVAAFLLPNAVNLVAYPLFIVVFLTIYTLRALQIDDHEALKRRFLTSWGRALRHVGPRRAERFNERFAGRIVDRTLDSAVLAEVERIRAEREPAPPRVILATAAPALYAKYIAQELGFEYVASPVLDRELMAVPSFRWIHMCRDEKCTAVQRLLGPHATFVLFTDSRDDWPLMLLAKELYLVRPSRELVEEARTLETTLRCL